MSNKQTTAATIDRRTFVADLLKTCPDALVIPGLGSANYDVFAAGDRPNNFYMWGAMGGAVSIGLGLALAQPSREVLVLTGDGEMLMGLGSLATVGAQQPRNLTIVVLDNGHFGETGMQFSHTSLGTDVAAVAKACSIATAEHVREMTAITTIAAAVKAKAGPALFQVQVKAVEDPRALPTRDGVFIKNRFRALLGLTADF